ncbi:hypothetical protein [Rhodoferax sp.]|uniref:hypothetical protein n=1 Tax=Rhodoferax sp. TaxID=50421 RepID=UPI00374D68FE
MNNFSSRPTLAVSESAVAGAYGVPGLFEFSVVDGAGFVSCYFSPTHSPNPGFWGQSPNSPSRRLAQRVRRYAPQRNWCLTPITQRGELHVAASVKVGNLVIESVLASKWPQRSHEALKLVFAERRLTSSCLQQIENPRPQFDGNALLRTFFPALKTRPNVAVGSLSAPAGVERVGERGGIQRIKNKNAASNRFGNSNADNPCVQKILQKQEHTSHITRGLTVKITKKIGQFPQTVMKELTA